LLIFVPSSALISADSGKSGAVVVGDAVGAPDADGDTVGTSVAFAVGDPVLSQHPR